MSSHASLSDMFRKDVYAADKDDIAVNAYYQQRASSIIRQNKVARNKLIPPPTLIGLLLTFPTAFLHTGFLPTSPFAISDNMIFSFTKSAINCFVSQYSANPIYSADVSLRFMNTDRYVFCIS